MLVICATAWAQGPQNAKKAPRTLVTARDAHSLTAEEAARAYPIHLRAVVTYYDPYIDARHGALFVHDTSGSIFVAVPARPILPLQAGNVVDVEGVSGPGDYAPIVTQAQVRVVGQSHVPETAELATMPQLLSGSLDGQWVEVVGIVHSVFLTEKDATLDIATVGGPLSATTSRKPGTNYDALVDSLIKVHGNSGPVFNLKRQMVGVHLFFPSLETVKIIQAAPPDPFAMPAVSIPQLLRFRPGLQLAHRVHVRGRVTLQWPGRTLCIQQANDGLCMQTVQTNPVSAGELVDVVGFPTIREYKATLETAVFHFAGGSASGVQVRPVTEEQALRGNHDNQLVLIEGELIGYDRAAGDLSLMLRSGKFLIPALLPRDSTPSDTLLPWKDGSLLRLTGICSVQVDPETTNQGEGAVRPGSARILLRSMGDVAVVRAPSWWTTGHTLDVLVIVAISALAALAWIIVLRRRVEQQTKALRSSEERLRHLSEHDALTGLPNRTLLNDRLSVALNRTDRFKSKVGVLMVDLDGFKEVNDALGHYVGDQVLRQVATRIQQSVRKTDTVARIGGDEFVVLLPDIYPPGQSASIARKIVTAVSAPLDIGSSRVPITVSVGVCTYPEGGTDAEALLKNADVAMYSAKARGRNRFHVYEPSEASILHD
ncbi:MAG: GGDEF domain-containing protein [Terracidiphilus sp.]